MSTAGHVNRSRNGKGRYRRDLEHIDRDRRASELIDQHWTYDQVAAELGYNDKGAAFRAVQIARQEQARHIRTEDLRLQQIAELETLKALMWPVVVSPPPKIDKVGRVVHDDDGNVVPDEQAMTSAGQVIIKANQGIARLRGLDAPKRSVTARFDVPLADIEARVAELRDEMGLGPHDDPPRPAIQGKVEAV
jgi:hypothetical protein